MIIEGAISVKAAILHHKREVKEVFINKEKKTKDFNFLRRIARSENIPVHEVNKEDLETLVSGRSHGGVCAEVSDRKNDVFTDGDIFFLDGIEDPFNIGYSLRTLYAFGVKNVLLSQRDYSSMQGQLLKSSAGALDMLNVRVVGEEEVLEYQKQGYHLYSLYRSEDAGDVFDTTFTEKALIILGGEKRGISASLLSHSDDKLFISYGSDFRNSLNACAALDVVATLLYAQRRRGC